MMFKKKVAARINSGLLMVLSIDNSRIKSQMDEV